MLFYALRRCNYTPQQSGFRGKEICTCIRNNAFVSDALCIHLFLYYVKERLVNKCFLFPLSSFGIK